MQSPATLIEYISTLDIVIFFGVPLVLLITVLAQEALARHDTSDGHQDGLPSGG